MFVKLPCSCTYLLGTLPNCITTTTSSVPDVLANTGTSLPPLPPRDDVSADYDDIAIRQ